MPSHGIRRRANSILLFYLYLQKERSGLIQHKVCIKCVDEHINDFLSHVKQKDDCSHRQGAPPMLHTSKRVEEPTTSAKRISKEHTARLHSFQGMAEYIMYFDTWILAWGRNAFNKTKIYLVLIALQVLLHSYSSHQRMKSSKISTINQGTGFGTKYAWSVYRQSK